MRTFTKASRIHRLFFILLIVGVSGCVTVAENYTPALTDISEPPLNVVSTAYVGDNMLRQGHFTQQDAIFLPSDVNVGMLGSPYTLKHGYYLKEGENSESEFYHPSQYEDGGAIVKAVLADPPKAVQAYKASQKLCVITVFNVHVCADHAKFKRSKQTIGTADSFQQTLIYSGRVGDKINVGYREFSNNMARPAFDNNVEYDLKESNNIGYKGAKVEILEVTNEYIKYKVIRNFNKAAY